MILSTTWCYEVSVVVVVVGGGSGDGGGVYMYTNFQCIVSSHCSGDATAHRVRVYT